MTHLCHFSSMQQTVCVCGRWFAKSEMNVTCFPVRFLFPLLTPRSVTTYLLQLADEAKQQCSEQLDNCHSSFNAHTRSVYVCVCECACERVHWGFTGLVAVFFSLFCLP